MTIFIDDVEMSIEAATQFIPEPDIRDRQIVRAWERSRIKHCFDNRKSFKKAVRRNRKTLKCPETIETLFNPRNYLFSTKANGREETLYFENRAAKQTGRLRQQHPKGPLARMDKRAKTHRFLSKGRFRFLKEWHKRHKGCFPRFRASEKRLTAGKHHLEFAFDGRKVSAHFSHGTVQTSRRALEWRISSALREILGIRLR